jgi:predicted nuclease of predicted toxin-antitoxin system
MRILLDENLPRKLKAGFGPNFEVKTVRDLGWLGKKNGELLGLMVLNGFDVFITIDKNLRHQQNLARFPVSVFLLMAVNNRLETLQNLIEKIRLRLEAGDFQELTEIR